MAQQLQDMELKEKVERDQFIQILHQWLDAIEGNHDLRVQVKGQNCSIPPTAMMKAKLEVEYEIDAGEYEFQLTMKWRDE